MLSARPKQRSGRQQPDSIRGTSVDAFMCLACSRESRCANLNATTGSVTLSASTAQPSIFWRRSRRPTGEVWNGKWSGRVRRRTVRSARDLLPARGVLTGARSLSVGHANRDARGRRRIFSLRSTAGDHLPLRRSHALIRPANLCQPIPAQRRPIR
jgi:hypothetical protein